MVRLLMMRFLLTLMVGLGTGFVFGVICRGERWQIPSVWPNDADDIWIDLSSRSIVWVTSDDHYSQN